jgi:hypothetical protein
MDNNINKKNTPDQMRVFLKRMRENNYTPTQIQETPKKDLNMRDMLKITRNLNENVGDEHKKSQNMKTVYDQSIEEQKMLNFFDDMNVNIRFIELEIYPNLVFWGGTVDGIIKFVYTVTPNENTSNVEFDYSEDFSPDNPDNDLIIKKLEEYYDIFYKYWRNNMVQK